MAVEHRTARDDVAHSPGQRADLVFFRRQDDSGLPGCPDDGSFVDRLKGVQVEDAGLVAEFAPQNPGRAHGFRNHRTTCDDREVFALIFIVAFQPGFKSLQKTVARLSQPDDIGLAENKGRLLVSNDGRGLARKADVLGTFVLEQQVVCGFAGLDCVAGDDHRHVRQAAHREQVFERLMGCAIRPHGDAAVCASDHDVKLAVADRGANLIEVARGRKGRVGAEHRKLSLLGKSRRDRGRRLLGDAETDPTLLALGLGSIEVADGDGARNVQAQAYDPLIVAVLGQRLAEALAGRFHFHFHVEGAIPPVVVIELRHFLVELAINFVLVGLRLVEQCPDRNPLRHTEFV